MNKKQLIRKIAKQTGLSICLSKIVVDSLIQTIISELEQGHKISLKDFGAFCNVTRQGKSYFDIHTKEIKKSASKNVVKFIPYKGFKKCPNIIELHPNNDGSLGDSIALEPHVFTYPQPTPKKGNLTPKIGKQNVGKRQQRKQDLLSSILVFGGDFLYDKFQGEADHSTFPSLKVPHKDTPILTPLKDKTGTTIGVMEPVLQESLREICKELKEVCILENVKLPILNRNYSYRPDICLHWEKKNVYIDIEIDEPYDIVSRKPTHYTGNGDNLRDRYFIRNGWCVLRFAEQQVHNNVEGVVNYIKRVLSWLTEDGNIKFDENSLDTIERWSYEQAETMASDNMREDYLGLPKYVPAEYVPQQVKNSPIFTKPSEDILPQLQESKWISVVDEIKKSTTEYCKVIKTNGYQWIYKCKTIETIISEGECQIKGDSPLGYEFSISLYEIAELVPLQNLFSDVHWENHSNMQIKDLEPLKEVLYDAVANGKPIWIAYNSIKSGYGTRFLSNLVYAWSGNDCDTPHIGLGHCEKYGIHSLSHFYGYCSSRKEFRMFAADCRIERLKVLNCNNVYIFSEVYSHSFAHLIMAPYYEGLAFFENADKILEIMPKNEFDSLITQGDLANLQVMKGDVDKAVELYTQNPYNLFITPTSTWGEACIADIKYFIDLFKGHLKDADDYYEFNAKEQMSNFEEVLKRLSQSSWMKNN